MGEGRMKASAARKPGVERWAGVVEGGAGVMDVVARAALRFEWEIVD
jgi:hypothetical protein